MHTGEVISVEVMSPGAGLPVVDPQRTTNLLSGDVWTPERLRDMEDVRDDAAMHGIVFDQLRAYADSLGPDVWKALLGEASISRDIYLVSEPYPDEELEALVGAATRLLERDRSKVLHDFGRFITPGLLSIYGVLLDRNWGLREVLLNTESTIHRVVRLRDAQADPPRLRILEGSHPNHVTILYDSPRRMCWLGKGIIEGLAAEYGIPVDVSDARCMHAGDPVCEMDVAIGGRSEG